MIHRTVLRSILGLAVLCGAGISFSADKVVPGFEHGTRVSPPPRPSSGWETEMEDAVKRARRTGKPVFLFFTARHSPPCQAMEQEVFTDEAVRRELGQVETVRIDVDAQPALAGRHRITELPAFLVLDTDEREYDRFIGFLPPGAFIETFRGAIDPKQSIPVLRRHIAQREGDLEAHWLLARKHARDRDRAELDAVLAAMRRIDPEDRRGFLDNAAYLEIMTTLDPRKPAEGLVAAESFLRDFPDSEFADQMSLTLALMAWQGGEKKLAIETLEAFPRRFPRSPLVDQVREDAQAMRKGSFKQ